MDYTKRNYSNLLSLQDAMVYKGVIACAGNPNYPAADAGHVYKVSSAGRIGGASGPVVAIGDMIICAVDGTAAGTHAAVGANWNIIQENLDIGAVIADTTLSGAPVVITLIDQATGTPYYIKGYPTKP